MREIGYYKYRENKKKRNSSLEKKFDKVYNRDIVKKGEKNYMKKKIATREGMLFANYRQLYNYLIRTDCKVSLEDAKRAWNFKHDKVRGWGIKFKYVGKNYRARIARHSDIGMRDKYKIFSLYDVFIKFSKSKSRTIFTEEIDGKLYYNYSHTDMRKIIKSYAKKDKEKIGVINIYLSRREVEELPNNRYRILASLLKEIILRNDTNRG